MRLSGKGEVWKVSKDFRKWEGEEVMIIWKLWEGPEVERVKVVSVDHPGWGVEEVWVDEVRLVR
jgi:hypothetical protein